MQTGSQSRQSTSQSAYIRVMALMHSNTTKLTFCFCFVVLFVVVMMSQSQKNQEKGEEDRASIFSLPLGVDAGGWFIAFLSSNTVYLFINTAHYKFNHYHHFSVLKSKCHIRWPLIDDKKANQTIILYKCQWSL
jgi:hypothetical protein